MAPGIEQRFLPGLGGVVVEAFDPSYDQPAGDLQLILPAGERDVRELGDLRVGDQFTGVGVGVDERVRVADRRPRRFTDGGDRGVHVGVGAGGQRHVRVVAGRGRGHVGGVELAVGALHDRGGRGDPEDHGEGLGQEPCRSPHVRGLAFAQADAGDHRPRERRGDDREQWMQGLLALQPAVLGALPGVAVDLPVAGVDVDEHHLRGLTEADGERRAGTLD